MKAMQAKLVSALMGFVVYVEIFYIWFETFGAKIKLNRFEKIWNGKKFVILLQFFFNPSFKFNLKLHCDL